MSVGEIVGLAAGIAAVIGVALAASPKVRDRLHRRRRRLQDLDGIPPRVENGEVVDPGRPSLAAAVHSLAESMDAVVAELKPNGGGSMRDRIDEVHALARKSSDRYATIDQRLADAARVAGEAARLAAIADQTIREFREESRSRHAENRLRLDNLERHEEDLKIQREFLLMLLKDRHGIDLLDIDDDLDVSND